MTGFKPRSSDVRSDLSANCVTNTAQLYLIFVECNINNNNDDASQVLLFSRSEQAAKQRDLLLLLCHPKHIPILDFVPSSVTRSSNKK